MNKNKFNGRKILPGVILVAFLAALATFFILLQVEKNALSAYEKELVWCAKVELAKDLEITKQGMTEYFEQIEIDKSKVPDGIIVDLEELLRQQTRIEIPQGTILSTSMFFDGEEYLSFLKKPVIAGYKSEDLYQVVSGVLRKGDLIHLYTVNEELEETYLLWENVMVYQVFDASGNMIASEDTTTPAARVNLILEKSNAEQFYNELRKGSLRVVKVWE